MAALKTLARDQQRPTAGADEALLRTAHSLAGGGGTFGFSELSERASHLEMLLAEGMEPDPASIQAALDALVEELERILK